MRATDKKTSTALVKAGLDPTSADMYWDKDNMGSYSLRLGKPYGKACTPAWSLQALLAQLPSEIVWNGKGYAQLLRKWYDAERNCMSYEIAYENSDGQTPMFFDNTDPVAAAADMLMWTLTNQLTDASTIA